MNPERNKGGRKANPDGLARKAYQVYCTSEDVLILRQLAKLPDEKIQFVKGWMDRGANIGGKK